MDDERRERYAAAIQRACYNAYAAETAPTEIPEYEIAADAAMAVADAEISKEREDMARALRFESVKVGEQMIELARLRAELEEFHSRVADYENRITWETNCGEHARLLDACRAADEKLERVRSVLDDMENGLGEEISAAKLRTALEGEQ